MSTAQDGAQVWVPDSEALWVKAVVVTVSGPETTVKMADGATKTINVEKELGACGVTFDKANPTLPLQNKDMPDTGKPDMADLDCLHEPAVLENLSRRHKTGIPYTYTGGTTISVNPYRYVSGLSTWHVVMVCAYGVAFASVA